MKRHYICCLVSQAGRARIEKIARRRFDGNIEKLVTRAVKDEVDRDLPTGNEYTYFNDSLGYAQEVLQDAIADSLGIVSFSDLTDKSFSPIGKNCPAVGAYVSPRLYRDCKKYAAKHYKKSMIAFTFSAVLHLVRDDERDQKRCVKGIGVPLPKEFMPQDDTGGIIMPDRLLKKTS